MDQLGRIIGKRYELQAQLGEGGMGAVYRARDASSGRTVALKLLQVEIAQDPIQVDRFRRESALLNSIEHPGLVRLLDASFGQDEPYLVFEVVEGASLESVLAGRSLDLHQAIVYTLMLADAVAALHGHKIIHRDLKPSNVMLRPDGTICLLDFGIAKHYGDAQRTLDRITTEGYVVGTPQYMPPEGLFGGAVLPAYDVWSIGVMFYEMVTGRRPFAEFEHSVPELASALMAGRFTPASQITPGLPRVVDACIERFLVARADQRLADGAEVCAALTELDGVTSGVHQRGGAPRTMQMAHVSAHTARASRKVSASPPEPHVAPSRWGRKAAAIAAVALALLACGGVALRSRPEPTPGPTATSSPAAPEPAHERKALRELAVRQAPLQVEKWLARMLGLRADRPELKPSALALAQGLAEAKLDRPLRELLGATSRPEKLDTPEDRECWSNLGWLAMLDHAAEFNRIHWPYEKRLAEQVDRVWAPIPAEGAGGDAWKHVIFRALDPDGNDKLFGRDVNGIDEFIPEPYTFRFKLPVRPRAARVWFASRDLSHQDALLVRLNEHMPVEIWTRSPAEARKSVGLIPEHLDGTLGGQLLAGRFWLMQEGGDDRKRVYAGREVPPRWLVEGDNTMVVSVVSLYNPQQPIKGTRPTIWVKIVSYQ